jgi:hypothetical protein
LLCKFTISLMKFAAVARRTGDLGSELDPRISARIQAVVSGNHFENAHEGRVFFCRFVPCPTA